jgi:nucleoside-diphosphate-sugar epimerase
MIIGNGLLAQAFAPRFTTRDDVLVFASGVSNSRETDPEEFARERRMLDKALAQANEESRKLVYFSTCSISDPDQANTPYVLHKQAQETLVAEHARSYAIFRLPQVVGRIDNPHTLTNYLYQTISSGDVFHVWTKARRNLIDVDDVASIGARLLERADAHNRVTNIACPFPVAILDLVRVFESVMDRRAYYDLIESGGSYDIDVELAMSAAAEAGLVFDDNYIPQLIRKYYAD